MFEISQTIDLLNTVARIVSEMMFILTGLTYTTIDSLYLLRYNVDYGV